MKKTMHEQNEKFNKEIEIIKEPQSNKWILELNRMTELKNSKESFNFRPDETKERISKLEDSLFEIIQSEDQNEKRMKSEESLQELWDTITKTIYTLWKSQKERRMRKEQKVYLKWSCLKTPQTPDSWGTKIQNRLN